MAATLTAERLRDLLDYDPETGAFRWRKAPRGRKSGDIAGSVSKVHGYREIGLDERLHLAHRLAWLYVHGRWPAHHIDHRDSNPTNNAIVNLREATHAENLHNRGKSCNNSSGFKGVSLDSSRHKWRAEIMKDRKRVFLGRFADKETAAAAYASAAGRLHGEFARVA
jgi:hypothetical protein